MMSLREYFWAKVDAYVAAYVAAITGVTISDAEVEAIDRAAEEVDRAADDLPAARRRLPAKRRAVQHEFRIGGVRGEDGSYTGGAKLFVRLGFYPDGRVGEVFLDTSKEGSDLRHFMNGFAVVVSLLLQFRVPVPVVAHALRSISGGPAGDVDDAELGIREARSMIDLVAQVLAHYEVERVSADGGTA